jgi:hypothetical protein
VAAPIENVGAPPFACSVPVNAPDMDVIVNEPPSDEIVGVPVVAHELIVTEALAAMFNTPVPDSAITGNVASPEPVMDRTPDDGTYTVPDDNALNAVGVSTDEPPLKYTAADDEPVKDTPLASATPEPNVTTLKI